MQRVPDVVEAYARPSLDVTRDLPRHDEMVDPRLGVRPAWAGVGSALRGLGPTGLAEQRRTVAAMLAQQGVTYRPPGASRERPWTLDPVPLVVDEQEWARLERALTQRAELLDLVLTDLYGPRRLLAEGLLPPEIVFGHPGFVRAVDGSRRDAARQLFLTATDLARGPDGRWTVLADRTQAPSGSAYAMVNRQVVSRALPGVFRETGIARLTPFFQAMRLALQALAPDAAEVPRVVLLTPGPGSETAYDQAGLSALLGFPLVQGTDLVVRDGQLWQRSIGRLERVDVVLRRLDADWCDPLELRGDSQLGVPGLVEAARLGSVAVVNGLGSGVLENPALFPYLPRLAEVLLDQPLLLDGAATWWCGDDVGRAHVLSRLDRLLLKPLARTVHSGTVVGAELTTAERAELAARIAAEPTAWVGQEIVEASTAPGAGLGALEARPVRLRTFGVAVGERYRLLPGGLGLTAPLAPGRPAGRRDGTVSKDVWVLTGAPQTTGDQTAVDLRGRVGAVVAPRVAETLFWLGRYAERAEDVSRLVAVTDTQWRDVHADSDPALRTCVDVLLDAVLQVTGLAADAGSVHRVLFGVIGDPTRVGTLVHDVTRVRQLAEASRDQLSYDTWAVLDGLTELLAPFDPRPDDPGAWADRDVAGIASRLRAALMAFAGLAHESMVRDTGWFFLDAGRRLERGLQLARLLRATTGRTHGPADALVADSTLVAAESIITYRRRYPGRTHPSAVLELLLLDHDNPRSLAFQLDRLTADLRRIAPDDARALAHVTRLTARLADAGATAAAAGPDGSRAALTELLDAVVEELHGVADAVEAAHFDRRGVLRQLAQQAANGVGR